MVVLQVTSSSAQSGGVLQAILLTRGLRERGHRVLFCGPAPSPALDAAAREGAETVALRFRTVGDLWRSSRELRRLARSAGADLVHAHHTKGHNVALLATFGGGFPPVIANRGVLFRPEFPAKFRSRRTAAIITNSARVKTVLQESRVPGRKIHVVYNATEFGDLAETAEGARALRRELDLEGASPVIGTVGSGKREKGFLYLVDAMPGILRRFPEARFLLVGGYTEKFLPRIAELGLEERCRVTGFRADARALMALMDVFVLPSIDMDSCPNVLLEAMALGVPAVGTDVGGVAEILEEGRVGTLVRPGDPGELERAVCSLLERADGGKTLGRLGSERIAGGFTLERKTEETLKVYRSVLGGARSDA
ncbi:MAG: glycosyltransferase family 4 protein [Deltaproteobacteria bacterium]|nr:glycosyltransferase family 4 protein [Deltaproteobacteria bacterium]